MVNDLTTIQNKCIAFRIPTNTDSQLNILFSDYGDITFSFSATNSSIQLNDQHATNSIKYMLPQSISSLKYKNFWISWSSGDFIVGMGDIINNANQIIIELPSSFSFYDLVFEYGIYHGNDWIFYDYLTSTYCQLNIVPRLTSVDNLPYSYPFVINSDPESVLYKTDDLNHNLWQNNRYLIFTVNSDDTAYIALQMNDVNQTFKFIFQSQECPESSYSDNSSVPNMNIEINNPITILKEGINIIENLHCTQYSDYNLAFNLTFWIWWSNSQLIFGDGPEIGNGILYRLNDDFLSNPIDQIKIASIQESYWSFYSGLRSIQDSPSLSPITPTPITPTPTYDRSGIIDRDDELICKRYYTHSNSKSDIDTIQTMNDYFIAFSVKSFDDDSSPQLILSHWDSSEEGDNANQNDRNNRAQQGEIDEYWWWSIELEITKQVLIVTNNTDNDIAQTIYPSKFRIRDEGNCYLDITYGSFNDENNNYCCQDHGLFGLEKNLFWNCQTIGPIWSYDYKTNTIYHKELGLYLKFGERGYGFQINDNDRNAKVTPYDIGDAFYFKSSTEHRYKIVFTDPTYEDNCQLAKDDQQVK